MTYILPQPCRCNRCGLERPSGGTADESMPTIRGYVVCPRCIERMYDQFCGTMHVIKPQSKEQP